MQLTLVRFHFADKLTIGMLDTPGHRPLYVLEKPREYKGERNVRCETCVLPGDYKVYRRASSRFGSRRKAWGLVSYHNYGNLMLSLEDRDGRSHCLLHVGNYPHNTLGCLLPGLYAAADKEMVCMSAIALKYLEGWLRNESTIALKIIEAV